MTVTLDLTSSGTVISADIIGNEETPSIGGAAIETIKSVIIGKTLPIADELDGVSGATFTSKGIKHAIKKIEAQLGY